jgi:hypothetical protein
LPSCFRPFRPRARQPGELSASRALLDASRIIPHRADDYRLRGRQLLAELGAAVPEAERSALKATFTTS